MPKNAELIESINKEAEARGLDLPNLEGRTNPELTEILKGYKATPVESSDDTPAEEPSNPEPAAPTPASTSGGYVLAKGVTLTLPYRGVVGEDEPIEAKELSGGQKAFDNLIEKGLIVKG